MVRLLNVYTISSFISLAGLLYGFDIASISGIVTTKQYIEYYGNPVGIRQGGIISAVAAGSLAGALSSSFLGDRLSRKVSTQLGAVLWCIGASLQSASTSIAMLVIGRIFAGFCIGITSVLVPIYQSEIAPRKIRGRIVTLQHFALAWGIVIMYFIQYGCSFLDSQAVFRLPWAIQAVPGIFLFMGLFWLPLSPRWLASKNRWDEVLQVLAFLRTPDCDSNDPLVLAEYKEIEEQAREHGEEWNTYREVFGKKLRKRLFIAMAVQGWSQLGGVGVLLYGVILPLKSAGVSNARLAASICYIIFVVATIPTILWTDHWGRRSSLLVGALSAALWSFMIGGLFMRFGEPNPVPDQQYTWIIVDKPIASRCIQASVYLLSATFAMSWGPIEWMYPPEIIPLHVRCTAVSLSTSTNWVIILALLLAVLPLWLRIHWGVFFMFGFLNLGAFIYVWLAVPETKQRTLEEMDEIFEHGEQLWRSFTGAGARYSNRLDLLAKDFEQGKISIHPRRPRRNNDIERTANSSTSQTLFDGTSG
ncbi:general substrate transporter [Lipomyces chichibuensis]|uniref:general substrate transporter n=1 Tax=Lipomyces chichibuensis TaxID=1546026 RepID=UPI0033439352